jgi:hypothetical protein
MYNGKVRLKKSQGRQRAAEVRKNGADPLPPHSVDAEQGVLGCILLSPRDCLAECITRIKAGPKSFYDLRHQTLFQALVEMFRAGEAIDLITLYQRLKDGGKIDDAGGLGYVSGLSNTVPSAANLQYYLDIVLEKYVERRVVQTCTEIARRVGDYEGDHAEAMLSAQSELRDLSELGTGSSGAFLDERRFDSSRHPPELRPVFKLTGKCIATPGNLATITAPAKVGKTAVIEAMLAAAMAGMGDADCLGFSSFNPDRRAVLHFDSEQSKDDHWHSVNRALKRARIAAAPSWLGSYCLTGCDYRQSWMHVLEAIRRANGEQGGIHSVFLDGAADFIADVNDAAESNAFVAKLHATAIEHVCPIICVIHFNPGSEKSRGHLGSQLERKAETNLRLDKAEGVTVIWSDKQRRAPIPKDCGPCFEWSGTEQMHVTARSRMECADEAERGELAELFRDALGKPAGFADLIRGIMGLGMSRPTAARRINRGLTSLVYKAGW